MRSCCAGAAGGGAGGSGWQLSALCRSLTVRASIFRAPSCERFSRAAICLVLSPRSLASTMRALREDALPPLMESISRLGIRIPLAVRFLDDVPDSDGVIALGVPVLVAGRHRLEAALRLGLERVPVVEFEREDDARRNHPARAAVWNGSGGDGVDGLSALPVPRQQFVQARCWVVGDAGQHVREPCARGRALSPLSLRRRSEGPQRPPPDGSE